MEHRLAAILHADVQGYSRLIAADEVATLRTLTAYLEMMNTRVQQHDGQAVGSRGDSLLAEFPSVVEAVQCAVEMQGELRARNAALPVERRVEFRMGINLGEIVVEGNQLHGEGINIAVAGGISRGGEHLHLRARAGAGPEPAAFTVRVCRRADA